MARILLFGLYLFFSCESSPKSTTTPSAVQKEQHPDTLLAPARALLADGKYVMAKIMARKYADEQPNEPVGIAAKKLIIMADSLTDAAQKVKIVELDRLKKPLRKSVDDMQGTTWWYAVSTPKYIDRNSFHVYLGEKDDDVWLRFRIQYYSDDWLFINVRM